MTNQRSGFSGNRDRWIRWRRYAPPRKPLSSC